MKHLKETRLGQWLSEKIPKVGAIIGDALPEKGVLGLIRNLVHNDPDLTAEQKLEFEKMEHDFETEMFTLEIQDKSNARQREVDFIKTTGRADYFQYFIGGLAVLTTCTIIFCLLYMPIPEKNEHVVMLFIGELLGIVTGIYSYHYGSSMGSRLKDMRRPNG